MQVVILSISQINLGTVHFLRHNSYIDYAIGASIAYIHHDIKPYKNFLLLFTAPSGRGRHVVAGEGFK